jgi:hypothetical protein
VKGQRPHTRESGGIARGGEVDQAFVHWRKVANIDASDPEGFPAL